MIDPYSSSWEAWLQKWFVRLLVPGILINAGGLLIPILEPDGALYATIAKTIAQTGDFIHLRVEGKDWLDKPHFPFWVAALSYRLFGINGFAYKFPALLFWALGGWYTYRLALSLYGKPVAQLATLIYVSAAHLVISNNDVRAEPYLTGLVIGSVYHFYKASRDPSGGKASGSFYGLYGHLVTGAFLAACAVMTKGPFVLITISAGLVADWIRTKDWTQFRRLRWWIALALIAVFILPELYCLYVQFDLHPEKIVFGRTGVSGIRFFFWDSQFGRFFNTGPIRGSGDPLFYFHTVLWAFLPWSLLLYAAIVQKCRRIGRGGTGNGVTGISGELSGAGPEAASQGELICVGAALTSFLVFSLSRFQLPHYLNLLFPFFSILTAEYLYRIQRKNTQKIVGFVQGFITIILAVLPAALCWLFHVRGWPFLLVVLLAFSVLAFRFFRGMEVTASAGRSYWMALLAYAFINFSLYPALLHYQAGEAAGDYVRGLEGQAGNDAASVYTLQEAPASYSFEFYCPGPVQRLPVDSLSAVVRQGPALVFLPFSFEDSLKARGYRVEPLRQFPDFHVSQLTGAFIYYRTRASVLDSCLVARVGLHRSFVFVGAGTITTGDGYVEQPQEYTQLCAVVDGLAIGHADYLGLGGYLVDLVTVTEGPVFQQSFFGGSGQVTFGAGQRPFIIIH